MRNVLLAAACAAAFLSIPAAAQQRVEADRATLERDVRVLADDSMEGREAGTSGYAMAAGYVAGRFAAIGLEPGGDDGTYFQTVPLRARSATEDGNSLDVTGPDGAYALTALTDYYGSGTYALEQGVVDAPLVFVGYGLDMSGRDDFAGLDLAGKIAVYVSGAPARLNTEERAHYRSTIAQRLSDRGAVGTLMLWTPERENIIAWDRAIASARGSVGMTWLDPEGVPYSTAPGLLASAVLSPEASRRLMEGQDFDYDDVAAAETTPEGMMPSFGLGSSARLAFSQTLETISAPNVVAMLLGTDPALADQYLVLTGHLDHEGVKPTPEDGDDEIFNGAMDNATGIATMLEVARLLKANPVRRPVLFVALTAEEKGLIGSSYNAVRPTVPAEQVAANLNLDMPIVTYEFTDLNAFGAERSNLYPAVEAAVEEYGLTLSPDPDPTQGLFVRSDQYSYIKQGVPAIYLKTGFADGGEDAQGLFRAEHYHQASDEADLVDFAMLARFASVNYAIARNVANMAERPMWNAGDFFGTMFEGPMAAR